MIFGKPFRPSYLNPSENAAFTVYWMESTL